MAYIVSSQIIEDQPQKDGRRWIRERHTDTLGGYHEVQYLAGTSLDVQSRMAERVQQIEVNILDNDLSTVIAQIEDGVDPRSTVYRFATTAQALKHVLQWFLRNRAENAIKIIPLLDSLTDTQIRNILGVSQTKVSQIRDRVTALKSIKTALEADDARVEVI